MLAVTSQKLISNRPEFGFNVNNCINLSKF